MLLFKKHKSLKQSASQQRISEKIINRWMQTKQKWSLYLQAKTEHFSVQSKKTTLIAFCILFGGLSMYLIINSFTDKNKNNLFSIHPITMPAYTNQAGDEKLNRDKIISKEEYEHIQSFKLYMDSLQSSSKGKALYDSMMQARPQLMDSIHLVENMYQSQSK
ncbi:hypothetical protein BH10BAC2_BH10BAC2_46510 [soil metagenome]